MVSVSLQALIRLPASWEPISLSIDDMGWSAIVAFTIHTDLHLSASANRRYLHVRDTGSYKTYRQCNDTRTLTKSLMGNTSVSRMQRSWQNVMFTDEPCLCISMRDEVQKAWRLFWLLCEEAVLLRRWICYGHVCDGISWHLRTSLYIVAFAGNLLTKCCSQFCLILINHVNVTPYTCINKITPDTILQYGFGKELVNPHRHFWFRHLNKFLVNSTKSKDSQRSRQTKHALWLTLNHKIYLYFQCSFKLICEEGIFITIW